METTISEIEVDSKDEKRPADVSPQEERRKGRTSTLCFKRRKKAAKTPKPKAGPAAAEASRKRLPEAGASDQPQRPGGVWASFKGLVTRKKRSAPSKKQKSLEAEVHPEIKTEGVNLSKKKAKSRLKIPCMRFSRGKQRDHHSKVTEDSDYHIQEQVEAEGLEAEAQTPLDEPAPQTKSSEPAPQTKSTEDLQEEASQKQEEEICESPVSNSIASAEHVISVELESENEHSAIPAETPIGEKEIDVMEETQSVQPQPASPLENSESESQQSRTPDAAPAPAIPEPPSVEEASNDIQESGPDEKDDENREQAAEENRPEEMDLSQAEETEVSQGPDLIENGIDAEKPKSEESKRMEPIAIIITDTEISEFDVKKSKNVPKQFLISMENEQVGVFANDSDFEGRTSEQYETLLIETASSLVKNAIQLSIEQLVNEMVSEDNQINTLLQ